MENLNQKIQELEEKIPYNQSDLLVTQLHDAIVDFKQSLKDSKSNLKKGDLVNLLIAITEFPVENTAILGANLEELYNLGVAAKRLLVESNIQILVEQGKEAKTGEENGQEQTSRESLEEHD